MDIKFAKWMLACFFVMRVTIFIVMGVLAIVHFREGSWLLFTFCLAFTIYGANETRKMLDDFKRIRESGI